MKKVFILFIAIIFLIIFPAQADITFPSMLQEIEEEAFAGNEQLLSLVIPEGTSAIGRRAFYSCGRLRCVSLPSTLVSVGDEAFSGCAEAMYFQCPPGSPARDWAAASGFDYSAGTVCRALLIGQTYSGTSYVLQGSVNDMRSMNFCLQSMKTRAYQVSAKSNLTADGILSAISTVFSSAREDDISLLFFSGHGREDGSILGADLVPLSPARLKTAMDLIPGRKVIIVDACYSGNLIEEPDAQTTVSRSRGLKNPLSSFDSAFLSAFSTRSRSGEFASGAYYVLTSCRAVEESLESYISSGNNGRQMGYFSYYLCHGCGWDGTSMRACGLYADVNQDGAVTLQEAFAYAYENALQQNENQHALVFPANCTAFSPFRP